VTIKTIEEFWKSVENCVPVGEPALTLHKQRIKIEAQAEEIAKLKAHRDPILAEHNKMVDEVERLKEVQAREIGDLKFEILGLENSNKCKMQGLLDIGNIANNKTIEIERLREAICIYVREQSPVYANEMWELDIDNKDEYAINLFIKHNQE